MLKGTKAIEWVLRIALCGEFLGHGVFAIIGHAGWPEMMSTVTGLSIEMCSSILPWIGVVDILVALAAIIYPAKPVLIWATFWAAITALARPLSGTSILAMVERFPNIAVPLALLLVRQSNTPNKRVGEDGE